MLKIYHIELRRSERVVWLMEELELPYELIFTRGDIMGSAMAIKAVHPIGAAPTIKDGDLWLCESGAILNILSRVMVPAGLALVLIRKRSRTTCNGCISPKARRWTGFSAR